MSEVAVHLLYFVGMAILVVGLILRAHRRPEEGPWPSLWAGGAASLLLAVFVSRLFPHPIFGSMALLCQGLFLHGPALLVALARRAGGLSRWALGGLALALALVGLDAFVVEPRWLEVRRVRLTSPKLTSPVKIVVLSDLQTDDVGDYEAEVLAAVVKEQPDVLLLPGDYIQVDTRDEADREWAALRALWTELGVTARDGVFAVEGNVEARDSAWGSRFHGLGVTVFPKTATIRVGELTLTGLTLRDSGNPQLKVAPKGGFHVIFGHIPDFSMGESSADLLIGGHTHGGQVQIPFYGPPITFSQLPRHTAAGGTFELGPGRHLVISRGVGLERMEAPPLRFLCRPELVVIELTPE
jgi:predicted MPP superfamily phosphohydrolase